MQTIVVGFLSVTIPFIIFLTMYKLNNKVKYQKGFDHRGVVKQNKL